MRLLRHRQSFNQEAFSHAVPLTSLPLRLTTLLVSAGHLQQTASATAAAASQRHASIRGVQPLSALAVNVSPRVDENHREIPQSIDISLQHQTVFTKFIWPAVLKGNEIFIWGSFNNWRKGVKLHRFDLQHDASVIMPLAPGNYEFKFEVDHEWTTAPHEAIVTNSQGNLNNFRIVAPTVTFKLDAPNAGRALVLGSWDNWQYALLLIKNQDGVYTSNAQLPPGQYSFYFIVDGQVVLQPNTPTVTDPQRGEVHQVWSFEPSIFRVFYCTGWDTTKLHYRRLIDGRPLTQAWQELVMLNAPSRGNSLGMWKMAALIPTAEDEALEFYLSNGLRHREAKEDRPAAGQLYRCPFPGSFKLVKGALRPFPRGAESRILLVSDIDGTMIGDMGNVDVFESSARFVNYWENSASLAGSLLAYNTGRSLGQFVDLMKKCGGQVAVPDVVITAVGTKIWVLNEEGGRSAATGLKWTEDLSYTQQLDEGWDLEVVRQCAYQLVSQYNDSGQLTVLDDGREHRHRIALCTDSRNVEHVVSSLSARCHKAGLQVRIIVSGAGSHRYVDCVSSFGGKEKALQHVRQQYGVPEHFCVAAGDSGNDVLMLEGDHPSIVVGNAQPELLAWLVQQRQTGKVIFTDAKHADGILEGLARHSLY